MESHWALMKNVRHWRKTRWLLCRHSPSLATGWGSVISMFSAPVPYLRKARVPHQRGGRASLRWRAHPRWPNPRPGRRRGVRLHCSYTPKRPCETPTHSRASLFVDPCRSVPRLEAGLSAWLAHRGSRGCRRAEDGDRPGAPARALGREFEVVHLLGLGVVEASAPEAPANGKRALVHPSPHASDLRVRRKRILSSSTL
jgi:hypothetical protein